MYFGKHLPQVVFLDTVRRTDSRLKQLYEATDEKEGRSWDGKKVRKYAFCMWKYLFDCFMLFWNIHLHFESQVTTQ